MTRKLLGLIAIMALAFLQIQCATKKHVRQEVSRIDKEMGQIETDVESNQTRLKEHDTQITQLSRETQEAMERAQSAEKLAKGKLLYEVTLQDEDVKFAFNRAELSDHAREVLENLINQLKAENKNIWIEVQGHTDNVGTEDYNMKLGLSRAEAVRRYLSENGIPLHRISTISYGETRPLTDNKSRQGRSKNRRVVILVLE